MAPVTDAETVVDGEGDALAFHHGLCSVNIIIFFEWNQESQQRYQGPLPLERTGKVLPSPKICVLLNHTTKDCTSK
jgi:hypothetical protein